MKKDRKYVEERQIQILDMIREYGQISVEDIAEKFQVSLMTIRRDLSKLEQEGYINRFYGGATANNWTPPSTRMDDDSISICRTAIARCAAQYVEENDSLFINGSMTALKLLQFVEGVNVNVFTNNLMALKWKFPDNVCVHLTGGEVRGHIMAGDYVMRNLLAMSADKTFIGCAGVYDNGEFRYDIPTEIGINEAMIAKTKGNLFVLADHTKINTKRAHSNLYGSCIYNRKVILITDDLADETVISRLKNIGMEVIQTHTGLLDTE